MIVTGKLDIKVAITQHHAWLAQQSSASLSRFGTAKHADLAGVDFSHCSLTKANLSYSVCDNAQFTCGVINQAEIVSASLKGADFGLANLEGTNLSGSDCSNANFFGCNLIRTLFKGTILTGTCLDPKAEILAIPDEVIIAPGLTPRSIDGVEYVYGWRTRLSQHAGATIYIPGRTYTAPVFSVSHNVCHPGIYLDGKDRLRLCYQGEPLVRCRCLRSDLHHVDDGGYGKFRCRRLEILNKAEQEQA